MPEEKGKMYAALLIILQVLLEALEDADELTDDAREFLERYRRDAAKGEPNYTDSAVKLLTAPKKQFGTIKSGKY